jgi:hypothetical protein
MHRNEISRQRRRFASIVECLKRHGFDEVTEERLNKIYQRLGLKPPSVERTRDVVDRISFIKEINGWAVYVHLTFNRKTRTFSKKAKLYIVISKLTDGDSERKLSRALYRIGRFDLKVKAHIDFFVEELKERWPLTKNDNWADLKEVSQDSFQWINEDETEIRDLFFHAKGIVLQTQEERLAYEKRRKKLDIKKRHRKIRKKYKKRKF